METYTVTAWDIYNLAMHKAEDDKQKGKDWRDLADKIKSLTAEFNQLNRQP